MVLEALKEKIQLKKEKLKKQQTLIKHKETVLKNQEKKTKNRRTFDIGNLAIKTQIDTLDPKALHGAFLEIAEKSKDKKIIQSWIEKCNLLQESTKVQQKILISFKTVPSSEIISQLKKMNLRWNSFRGEYYGYGHKDEFENLLKGLEYTLEVKD